MLPLRITESFCPAYPAINTPAIPMQKNNCKSRNENCTLLPVLILWLCYSQCPSHPLTQYSCDSGVRTPRDTLPEDHSSGGSYGSPHQALMVSAGHSLSFMLTNSITNSIKCTDSHSN